MERFPGARPPPPKRAQAGYTGYTGAFHPSRTGMELLEQLLAEFRYPQVSYPRKQKQEGREMPRGLWESDKTLGKLRKTHSENAAENG